MESEIKNHYNSDNLTQKIKTALIKSGKILSAIEIKDLSPVDQIHTGGARTSIALFNKVGFSPGAQVLDAGCGIGGSSRLLAKRFNCRVVGIDLADRFIEAATFLTQCTRLENNVVFQQGSVLELPFEDSTFDAVVCQHILMNIEDKSAAIKEFFRVLKPGGKLILHEITRGENASLLFPVPWAENDTISFLETWDITNARLAHQGFETQFHSDETRAACRMWEKVKAAPPKRDPLPNPLSLNLVFGDTARFFADNMHANFTNNSICLVEAILKKRYDTKVS